MKRIIKSGIMYLSFLLFGLLVCCKTTYNQPPIQDKNAIICPIKTAFPVSGQIEFFIKEYCGIDPTISQDSMRTTLDKLAKHYYLRQMSDTCYYLCGFIKTDSVFNEIKFREKGVKLNDPVGNLRSVCIPLSAMKFFFTQSDILSFEADMPVYPFNK